MQATTAEQQSEKAFRAFVRTSGLFRHHMRPYFARFGISGAQWGVLRVLYRADKDGIPALRQTDLGDRLLVRAPSVTGLVDRLVRMELVRREATKEDLRAKHIRLTQKGRQLVLRVQRAHEQQIKRMMAGLSGSDQRQLQRLMMQLGGHLEALAGGSGGKNTFEANEDEEVSSNGK